MQAERKIDIHRWLNMAGLEGAGEQSLVQGYCQRLAAAGAPLARFAAASNVLHPIHEGRSIIWHGDGELEEEFYGPAPESLDDKSEFSTSPFFHLISGNDDTLYRNLAGDYQRGEFPLCDRFQDEGMTAYFAVRIMFGDGGSLGHQRGMVVSYCSHGQDGLSPEKRQSLVELSHGFALSFKAMTEVFTGRTLMRTYLGATAAKRVLKGDIHRARAEAVDLVLWYSDLQGFTRMADNAAKHELMPFLNDYAECVAHAVENHDGEILKFIGDGVLAMFAADEPAEACARALDAAILAQQKVAKMSRRRQGARLPTTGLYLGLHRGEVLLGNIGSRDRLDFTVIGPAVNELARIEQMCRSLDQRIVISSAFARTTGIDAGRLVSLGRYALRGVARPQELFTIDTENSINIR